MKRIVVPAIFAGTIIVIAGLVFLGGGDSKMISETSSVRAESPQAEVPTAIPATATATMQAATANAVPQEATPTQTMIAATPTAIPATATATPLVATATPAQVPEVLKDNWQVMDIITRDGRTFIVFDSGDIIPRGEALLTGNALGALSSVSKFDNINVEFVMTDGPITVTGMSKVVIRPPCSCDK